MTQPRFRTRPAEGALACEERPSLHVVTFGCQMNKYDSLLVEGRFLRHGYRLVERPDEADVILFNTCSVRDHAEERVYSWVGELKRLKARRPELVIGVLGCMAQRAREEIFGRAAHVDLVVGTRRIQHLPAFVDEVRERRADPDRSPLERRVLEVGEDDEVAVERAGEAYAGGLVGHLAVMRGCDLNCTFCIVPTVRGRVQSRPVADLVREARWMVEGGARVLTLLGQTVDAYGADLSAPGPHEPGGRGRGGRPALADLLRALQELDGLARVRLITLHPAYVDRALAEAIRDCDRVDRFLPLPAQSGSDAVLRRMKRGYTTELYRRRVEALREVVPDVELGSDWIVGFPGESEADYRASEAFLAEIGFAQGYVFQYDPRPGTAAATLPDDVPREVKAERNHRLLAAVERTALARMEAWIGREAEAFLEEPHARFPGTLRGRTRHGLSIRVEAPERLVGTSARVRVDEASAFGLAGVAVS